MHSKGPFWRGSMLVMGLGAASAALSLCAARHSKKTPVTADDSFTPSTPKQVVQPGDTLWSLTEKVTGKPWAWPRVWAMNPEITNPHWLYPGDVVRFVAPTEAGATRAEMVASSMDIPQATDAQADAAAQGPRVEVINTAPPPSREKRQLRQKVFNNFYVTTAEMEQAGTLSNALPDRVLLNAKDWVYLTFPRGKTAKMPGVGDRFFLFRTVSEVVHPDTHKHLGYMSEVTGAVTVELVEKDVARARIDTIVREVERGQYLTPFTGDLMLNVAKVASPKNTVEGIIVAVEGDLMAAGEQKLVFIDKGTKDGLERGTALSVRSRGDPLLESQQAFPNIDVATLLVVDAKDTSSTCLVVDAMHEVWPGDPVRTLADVP